MRMCGIAQLIDAALSGFNVTIMAYGQTGSGKTCAFRVLPERTSLNAVSLCIPLQPAVVLSDQRTVLCAPMSYPYGP